MRNFVISCIMAVVQTLEKFIYVLAPASSYSKYVGVDFFIFLVRICWCRLQRLLYMNF